MMKRIRGTYGVSLWKGTHIGWALFSPRRVYG
jgi:hypothetical protein